jgi:hypothetical protein
MFVLRSGRAPSAAFETIVIDRLHELRKYAEERVAEYAQNSAGASHPDEKATWRARHIAWQRVLSIYDFIEVVQSVLKGRGRNLH